jgi:hypothetical protein
MMSKNLVTIAILACVGLAAFAVTASADQLVPRTAQPKPAPIAAVPAAETLVLQGRGSESAARALRLSLEQLPFTAHLPQAVPSGYELAQAESRIFPGGKALVDVIYTGQGDREFQIFESNYPNDKPILAPVDRREDVILHGLPWRYLLLSFPQPDGTRVFVHSLDRAFDGSTYIAVNLRSVGDLAGERLQLMAAAESLG